MGPSALSELRPATKRSRSPAKTSTGWLLRDLQIALKAGGSRRDPS